MEAINYLYIFHAWHHLPISALFPDKLKKHEIEMKPNQAYETVTRPRPATQVHTKPCPAYEVVVQAHH